jgi:hypothetical protein
VNETTDVPLASTESKLFFFLRAWLLLKMAKKKIARLRPGKAPYGRGSAAGANAAAREILSTFGSRLVFAFFRWGTRAHLCPG